MPTGPLSSIPSLFPVRISAEGDYDVVIPASAEGMYKIRVGLFGDDSVYACSEAFEVSSSEDL